MENCKSMRWAIQLSSFSAAIFISCDSGNSTKCSSRDVADAQNSNDMGFAGDIEDRLPGIGDKCLIPEILEGLKVVENWSLELDRRLCVEENYNLSGYQRGYSVKPSRKLVRIWLGGKLGLEKDIDPERFVVEWIRFEYREKYRTFEKYDTEWKLVEDILIDD